MPFVTIKRGLTYTPDTPCFRCGKPRAKVSVPIHTTSVLSLVSPYTALLKKNASIVDLSLCSQHAEPYHRMRSGGPGLFIVLVGLAAFIISMLALSQAIGWWRFPVAILLFVPFVVIGNWLNRDTLRDTCYASALGYGVRLDFTDRDFAARVAMCVMNEHGADAIIRMDRKTEAALETLLADPPEWLVPPSERAQADPNDRLEELRRRTELPRK